MNMKVGDIDVRQIGAEDLPAAHGLSVQLNWPHRLEDWRFFDSLGTGFGAYTQAGELAGTAYCWPHSDMLATLGMVIVSSSLQGKGVGAALTRAAIDAAGARSIQLNATEAGFPLYEKLGFVPVGTIQQHQGVIAAAPEAPRENGMKTRPIEKTDEAAIGRLDAAAVGTGRSRLLASLMSFAEGRMLEEDGKPAGFALIRPFGRGRLIGPIVAPDTRGARLLVGDLLKGEVGNFVRIDTPSGEFSSWLQERGLQPAGPVTAMVKGRLPDKGGLRLFGLVSQALG